MLVALTCSLINSIPTRRNYAKSHPDLCILAVNTFVQDSEDPNPLIRALAIRTMGCIRVEKMVDYMEEPLRKTLRDESPYVRKTAAICVAKLFDLNPPMCLENGFLEMLQEMIGDPNPMVVKLGYGTFGDISLCAGNTSPAGYHEHATKIAYGVERMHRMGTGHHPYDFV